MAVSSTLSMFIIATLNVYASGLKSQQKLYQTIGEYISQEQPAAFALEKNTRLFSLRITPEEAHMQNISMYNSKTEICCNGTVQAKGSSDSCCGNVPYKHGKFVCCDEQLLASMNATNSFCCHNEATGMSKLYQYDTQICCEGTVFEKPEKGGMFSCCHGQLFSFYTQQCCGGQIIEKAAGQRCCGEEAYDNKTKACCYQYDKRNGHLYNLIDVEGDLTECCAGAAYDPTESVCCNDTIAPLPEDAEEDSEMMCCGTVPYVYGKQECCSQWVRDYKRREWVVGSHLLLDIVGGHRDCCGKRLYDPNEEVCCYKDKFLPLPADADEDGYYACCGQKVYNQNTQLCSDEEKVLENPGRHFRLCGGKLIDYRSQSCCFDVAYDDDGPMACCHSAKAAYNRETQLCCGDQVVTISKRDKALGKDACCSVEHHSQVNTILI